MFYWYFPNAHTWPMTETERCIMIGSSKIYSCLVCVAAHLQRPHPIPGIWHSNFFLTTITLGAKRLNTWSIWLFFPREPYWFNVCHAYSVQGHVNSFSIMIICNLEASNEAFCVPINCAPTSWRTNCINNFHTLNSIFAKCYEYVLRK